MYFMVLCFGIISHIFGFCCTFLSSVQQPQAGRASCHVCQCVYVCALYPWARYFIIIKHQEQHEQQQQQKKQQRQLDQLRPGKCLQLSLADDMQSFCHVARNWQWSWSWSWSWNCLHPFVLTGAYAKEFRFACTAQRHNYSMATATTKIKLWQLHSIAWNHLEQCHKK